MKFLQILLVAAVLTACASQKPALKKIGEANVTRIETVLSADDMQGRAIFTPAIDKAANFISNEMKNTRLRIFEGNAGYIQNFSLKKLLSSRVQASINGQQVDPGNVVCISTIQNLSISNNDDYILTTINAQNARARIKQIISNDSNMLVLVDTSFARSFTGLRRMQTAMFEKNSSKIFVLTSIAKPEIFSFTINQQFEDKWLKNIIGYLPGKSKRKELVVFSAHYDHLGIGKPDDKNDSIYNGANDDASGITAMLSLARYYKKWHRNKRSVLFVAFTGEESGGYGSNYFSKQINPKAVVAMFNIEMVGTESKWGKNSAYITGFERSDFGSILQNNVKGSPFSFYPDPYPEQNLFFRSDNATLARLGVPAHTISTSKMNNEPHYHKQSDEIKTLDMKNMTEVIKAIAVGANTIVSGRETPSRVIVE